ncbi:WhiB family transcriptional regulator [Mycobacteroides abscessus]|uniref:Transcriptional regulator WhiB n=1 Tax=Mycobacteroides abscessus TaxID=36809 RepID=A0A0U0ZPP6_9MYCO|nr:WhiB family transcriptional regulator [Mycobacteroides abscessus]MBL3735256.1 WhiB family transcriptional regulator [Mycobacteroides abscessus subsp. massiliense]MBL3746105.1 WhiB family transcriptional regulator [Mycobacteroides abscessus subsp. massiliense]MBL3761286.1 WhiB family transcriptional regulator [Mycobacteroides abscessus subsp. massiliense]MBN7482428.1 WhiB family transcriptional regulator [Mycobacteroides abscessus subsp. massiliense]MDB2213655.1 WhiB family transcriptional r
MEDARIAETTAFVQDLAWQLRGACRNANHDLFYANDDERPIERRLREQHARDVCRSCAVATRCLAYALEIEEPHGIWGGMSEVERHRIRLRVTARSSIGQ